MHNGVGVSVRRPLRGLIGATIYAGRRGDRDRDGPPSDRRSTRAELLRERGRTGGPGSDLGGGSNPRKEQRRSKLQHTSSARWTRRWYEPLKPAVGLRKQREGGEGAEVTGRMFEASAAGPRTIELTSAPPPPEGAPERGSRTPGFNGQRRSNPPSRHRWAGGDSEAPGRPRGRQRDSESSTPKRFARAIWRTRKCPGRAGERSPGRVRNEEPRTTSRPPPNGRPPRGDRTDGERREIDHPDPADPRASGNRRARHAAGLRDPERARARDEVPE